MLEFSKAGFMDGVGSVRPEDYQWVEGTAFGDEVREMLKISVTMLRQWKRRLCDKSKQRFVTLEESSDSKSHFLLINDTQSLLAQHIRRLYLGVAKGASDASIGQLIDKIGGAAAALASTMETWMTCSGPTLQKELRIASVRCIGAVEALLVKVLGLSDRSSKSLESANIAVRACEDLSKTSQNDHSAVCKQMLTCIALMNDGRSELEDLQQVDPDSALAESLEGLNVEDEDMREGDRCAYDVDDWGNEVVMLSAEQFVIVEPTTRFVKAAVLVVKRIYGFLLRHNDVSSSQDWYSCKWLEGLLSVTRAVSAEVDKLASCIHPPQNRPEASRSAKALHMHMSALLNLASGNETFAESSMCVKGGANAETQNVSSLEWSLKIQTKIKSMLIDLVDVIHHHEPIHDRSAYN